jgi:toxin ParE1/3/4
MSRVELVWSQQALDDLTSIHEFIARTSPRYGALVVARLVEAMERVVDFPESGRVVPELSEPRVREVLHGTYRLMYEVQGSERVEVLTVFRASRRFPPTD